VILFDVELWFAGREIKKYGGACWLECLWRRAAVSIDGGWRWRTG
jgi:hypothetical protein